MFKSTFAVLQEIGKAMMLPVAVLPIAGILLGIGQSHFAFLPDIVSEIFARGGGVIFENLPILFCISVAFGLSRNDGVAALAGTVGYVVMLATMGIIAPHLGAHTTAILGITTIDTGVFGGIFMGALTATLYRRYFDIRLPSYLGFFAGKRFVPIIVGLAALFLGVLLSLVWPAVQQIINQFSHWAAHSDPRIAATIYGVVERLLIPFGLHHIWNMPFFFEIGSWTNASGQIIHGDINRFFAGDPTAGILSGAFLFKMWGLPAAALAIWRSARPENRLKIASLMIPMALTSFLTGITEPIEFSFLFVAPELYGLHALLAGACQFLANTFDMHMGFTFSQGFFDFLLFNLFSPHAHNAGFVFVFGPLTALVYYALFTFAIRRFHLPTPGRESASHHSRPTAQANTQRQEIARRLTEAFGGAANITSLDACVTRLRVSVADSSLINKAAFLKLGAAGVMILGQGVQVVFGTRSGELRTDMEAYLGGAHASKTDGTEAILSAPISEADKMKMRRLTQALGGMKNIRLMESLAGNRLRVWLADTSRINRADLTLNGVHAIASVDQEILHLIMGRDAADICRAYVLALHTAQNNTYTEHIY